MHDTDMLYSRNDVLQTLQASLSATATASNVSTPAATPADSRMNEELERSAEHGSALEGESAGKVLERLMDWIEARQVSLPKTGLSKPYF